MRHSLIAITLLSALTALPVLAQSPYLSSQSAAPQRANDNFPYWYLGLNAQLSYVDDSDVSSRATGVTEIEYDTGYGLGASLGFRPYIRNSFLSNTRYEIEYTYRDVEASSMRAGGVGSSLDAGLETHSIMANLYYDIDTGTQWTPYIGGGLGMAFLDLDSPTLSINDSDELFAYQGMVGVSYAPEALPQTEWGFGYRYFGATDPELTDTAGNAYELDVNSHNFEVFSRFRF